MWNAISSLLLCSVALSGSKRVESLEPHMGTMFRIVLYADGTDNTNDTDAAHLAIRAAFDRVAELDNRLSDYKLDSELNRLARDAVHAPVAVSKDLYEVLQVGQKLAEQTNGAFDVTVGPLVRLWREARRTKHLPAPDAIAAATRVTGYRKLHLRDGKATLDLAGMQLDLGAIAKGYAADEALRVLRERGFPRALVAASGDIAIGDAPPDKTGWTIGVDSLNPSNEKFAQQLSLHNIAVSTSGDTEQYLEAGGVRYSHIVNPKTGKGLTVRAGVTVIAKTGMDADSLATAASVLIELQGVGAANGLIESHGARAFIVLDEPASVRGAVR